MNKKPVSLLDWAYVQIKEQIYSGKLDPGKKIIVNNLADSLAISPTPIKGALNRLVAEGLLVKLPRRGFMVKKLSMREIRNIVNCRIMMETFAAQPAAANLLQHPEIRKTMRHVLQKLEDVQNCDYFKAIQLEQVYHGSIIRLAENDKLTELYNLLFGVSFSFYVYSSSHHPMERHRVALQEHQMMLQYLEEGDGRKLEELLRSHLQKTLDLYETFI